MALAGRTTWPPERAGAGLHVCPVLDCKERVVDEMLACRHHWLTAPRPVRARVSNAWRKVRRAQRAGDPLALEEALEAHEVAVRAFGAWWDENGEQPAWVPRELRG